MIPAPPDLALLGLIVAAFAVLLVRIERASPARLLASHRETVEAVRKVSQDAGDSIRNLSQEVQAGSDQIDALRSSWRVHLEEIEKFLDSIDTRSRRISATESNAKRRERNENGETEVVTDPETLAAGFRARAGIG